MTRTTVSLHESTLKKVKALSKREHITLGEAFNELLNLGLDCKRRNAQKKTKKFSLATYSMGKPRVPLEDKEALHTLLDEG